MAPCGKRLGAARDNHFFNLFYEKKPYFGGLNLA